MSRATILFVLAVLVVLLGVMSAVTTPKSKEQAQKEAQAKNAEIRKQTAKEEIERRAEALKQVMDARQKSQPKGMAPGGRQTMAPAGITAPRTPNKPDPTQMNITQDWFRERTDGERGAKQVQAEVERYKKEKAALEKATSQKSISSMDKPILQKPIEIPPPDAHNH